MESESTGIREVKKVLSEEFSSPSSEFIRFLAGRIGSPVESRTAVDRFSPLVKEAFRQFVEDRHHDPLPTVVAGGEAGRRFTGGIDSHTISDEEFEGYFIVSVA